MSILRAVTNDIRNIMTNGGETASVLFVLPLMVVAAVIWGLVR